jgi:preprotein translocase subunit SecF/SecD/SecF fusion protein
VIRGFTSGLIWGIVIGTYSSIAIAVPLVYFMGVRREAVAGPEEAKAKSGA